MPTEVNPASEGKKHHVSSAIVCQACPSGIMVNTTL